MHKIQPITMVNVAPPGKLIMVADDDEDFSYLLATQIEQLGYLVHKCPGGENLVAEVLQYKPVLLLLDITMQLIDGSALCAKIKQHSRTKHIKIVLMSGNHDIALRAASCGADGYIAKPLSIKDIRLVVSEFI
jgi:CheY-like chemotaxis protein